MSQLTPNYNLILLEATDPLADFRAWYNATLTIIDNNLGGGGGGHTIVDPNDSDMPAEGKLQFTGNVSVTDDSGNGKTVVDILGGGGNVYGVFIDTNHIITSGTYSGTFSYTATEDCAFRFVVSGTSSSSGKVYLDGVIIQSVYVPQNNDYQDVVFVKKGQTVKIESQQGGTWNYAVYGLTQGTDSIFTPIIYSDNERVIGIWRDNKPLYQRSWTGTKSTSSDEIIINDPPSIDTLANSFVTIKGSTGSQIAQYYRDSNDRARIWLEGGKIHMDSGASYPIMPYTYTVTLQYTKTTDVAGSGNWSTDGVPTVHYSTTEQVIGTWIDGKPLYQTTFVYNGNINANAATNLVNISSLNAESVVALSGSIYESGWGWEQVPTNNFRLHYNTNSGYIEALTGAFAVSGDCYITVQYTKTTDT